MLAFWRIPVEVEILDVLPVRWRPGLYIARVPLRGGDLLVLEPAPSGAADDEVILGLVLYGDDGWYLGCVACRQPIGEAAAGMCDNCRLGGGIGIGLAHPAMS